MVPLSLLQKSNQHRDIEIAESSVRQPGCDSLNHLTITRAPAARGNSLSQVHRLDVRGSCRSVHNSSDKATPD
jgi:hypothetical protein